MLDRKDRQTLLGSALLALAFVTTCGLFVPLNLYLGNPGEFTFPISDLLVALLVPTGLAWGALFVAMVLLPSATSHRAVSVLAAIALLVWIQGNLLVWDYGALDGRPIDWGARWHLGMLDGLLWIAVLGLAVAKPRVLAGQAAVLGVALVLIQSISVGLTAIRAGRPGRNLQFSTSQNFLLDESQKFTFSTRRNVILLILDGFQSSVLQEILSEDAALRRPLDGFTYYRNNLSGFTTTILAVPEILTGRQYDNSQPYLQFLEQAYLSDSSLPRALKERGFYVDLYTVGGYVYNDDKVVSNIVPRTGAGSTAQREAVKLLDVSLFRALPHFLKRFVYNDQRWLLARAWTSLPSFASRERSQGKPLPGTFTENLEFLGEVEKASFTVTPEREMFKVYHLHGTHAPPTIDESLRSVSPAHPTMEDYRRTGRGVMKILERFLDRLSRIGVYDQSMIVVVGDHGLGLSDVTPETLDLIQQRHPGARSLGKVGFPPLLLVKPLGSRGPLRTSDAPVANADIPATVLSELGLVAASDRSILDVPEDADRARYFYRTNPSHTFGAYYSSMEEMEVRGFSWSDSAWRPTGRQLGLGEPIVIFNQIERKEHVGSLRIRGLPEGKVRPRISIDSNKNLVVNFERPESDAGDAIRLELPLTDLHPGRTYTVSLEVFDPHPGRSENLFAYSVELGDRVLYRRDGREGSHAGWQTVAQSIVADAATLDLVAQLRTLQPGPPGVTWGFAAQIGIRHVVVREAEPAGEARSPNRGPLGASPAPGGQD